MLLADGSVRLMAHTSWAPWAGEVILEARSWQGPYKVVGSDLIDHCAYCEEDPFMCDPPVSPPIGPLISHAVLVG